MAFLIVLSMLVGTIVLAPWLGRDSRGLSLERHESTHPLLSNRGVNC